MGWLMGNHHGPSLTDEQLEDFNLALAECQAERAQWSNVH